MKRLILITLMFCGLGVAQDKAIDSTTQPTLTIYNQNFFVAREHVPLDLKAGSQPGRITPALPRIWSRIPSSCAIPAGRALQILEQNYRNDPISQELLLSFYEGKTIDFPLAAPPKARTSR